MNHNQLKKEMQMKAEYANQAQGAIMQGCLGARDVRSIVEDRTVRENIEAKIAGLQAEISRLEESKKTLGPLLEMSIRDIREAMNY